MKRFTKKEDQFIEKNYLTIPAATMSRMLGRCKIAVPQRMKVLNLIVPQEIRDEFKNKSVYQKGQTPLNKGKKMKEWMCAKSIAKVKKTQFKKGRLPHNTKQDFAISKRMDKIGRPYLFIRIGLAKWVPLQRYVWEQANGPIPKKHKIIFKDKNTLNCNIENLEMISHAGHMLRNSAHRFGPEIFKIIQLRGALNRQINKLLKQLSNEK